MMQTTIDTLVNQDSRRFRAYEYAGRFIIREWPVTASMNVLGRTRQQAWDVARAQLLPVTFIGLDGVESDLGVVASELVKVALTEAAWKTDLHWKNAAAQREAAQELTAEQAKWDDKVKQGTVTAHEIVTNWKTEKAATSSVVDKVGYVVATTGTFNTSGFSQEDVAEVGVYRFNGSIYRVVWNKSHTKRYAQLLVLLSGGTSRWDYEAAKGLVLKLKPQHRLTKAELKSFGDEHHFCCCCRRKLTVKLSIERGIGPVCWEKYGYSD